MTKTSKDRAQQDQFFNYGISKPQIVRLFLSRSMLQAAQTPEELRSLYIASSENTLA